MSLATTINRVSYTTNGITVLFSFPYYFLADADLVVIKRLNITPFTETTLVLNTDYTVTGAGVQAGGSITTTPVIASGYTLSIYRNPSETQPVDLVENDPLPAETLEKSLDRLTMIMQNNSDLITRSVKLSPGYPANTFDLTLPPNLSPNTVFIVNPGGTGLSSGPTADEITNAQGYALAAQTSASNALASETAAAGSASSAAASATAAATAVASAFFRDVVYITFSDSPITLAQGDNGKLYVCDTSAGAIVLNLPTMSGITTPFNIAVKVSDNTNTVTINPGGSDTIDLVAAAKVLSDLNETGLFVADKDKSPDDWTSIIIDSGSSNISVVTKTTTYNTSAADDVILVNTAGGDVTINLHTAANATKKRITVKKISLDSNAVLLTPNGSEKIDFNYSLVTLNKFEQAITIVPDGSNWFIESRLSTLAKYFASSQITTDSSSVTSTSFVTYSNSPAFTIIPTITGILKVYCPANIANGDATGRVAFSRITNTSGSATLLHESISANNGNASANFQTMLTQSVYTVIAGTTYVFDIQGKVTAGGNSQLLGVLAPFYMYAELV